MEHSRIEVEMTKVYVQEKEPCTLKAKANVLKP